MGSLPNQIFSESTVPHKQEGEMFFQGLGLRLFGYIPVCMYLGGCQNYGPFLDSYSNTAP